VQYIKADTNTEVLIGPAVAVGDGFTPVTTLSLSTADEAEIIKYGGATPLTVTSISANGFAAITSADGYYTLDITTGNSDTEGFLTVLINDDSLILPIRVDFMVVNANVYDSLFAAATTDYLQTDATQWNGTAVATPTTAGVPEVELARISGQTVTAAAAVTVNAELGASATAMDAFEDQYDGTGLTGETYPATQAQIGAIGSATGGGLSFEAESDNVLGAIKSITFVGVQTSGTYASTEAEDSVYHNITHTGNAIDIVYQFNVGGARTCSEILFKGYLSSSNDTITVQMYDYVGADWETRGSIVGQGGTTNATHTFKALSKHTGTGADLGICLIRFVCTAQTAPDFFVDELVSTGISEGQSVGYANGAVWIDTTDGVAGTESFVNGVADNPVSTLANAITIASNVGLDRFISSADTSITFAESHTNEVWNGMGWTLALGGQDVSGIHVHECQSLSGTGTTPTAEAHFTNCEIGTMSMGNAHFIHCGFDATLTLTAATDYFLIDCYSQVAGASSPTIDMGAAVGASNVSIRRWSGGLTINNLAAGDVVSMDGIFGTITLNGADATVEIRGIAKAVTNNLTGSPTVNDDSLKTDIQEDWTDGGRLDLILDAVVADTNELQTDWANGGRLDLLLDDVPTTAEFEARTPTAAQLAYIVANAATGLPVTFTTAGGSTTAAVLNQVDGAGASSTNDQYNSRLLVFTDGTLKGVVTDITDYDGATTTATITAIPTAPTSAHSARLI
jgi:hypothetical protein